MSVQTVESRVTTREEVEKSFEQFGYVIDDTLEKALKFDVCSQWAAEEAVNLVAKVKGYIKKIEEVRKHVNEPYRKAMAYNNDRAKPFTDKLEKIEVLLKAKLEFWKKKREKEIKEKEEEAKLMQAALQLEVNPFMGDSSAKLIVRTVDAMSYEKSDWKFEVECLAEVPLQYLKVDEDKIKAMIRAGIRDIPGIKVYEEKKTIIRSR